MNIESAFPFINAAEKKVQDAIGVLMAMPAHNADRMAAAKQADYAVVDLIDELTRLRNEVRKMY